MIKAIQAFAIVFAVIFFGIQAVRALTGKEKWALAKLLTYSAGCAILTVMVLAGIVVLF